MTQRNPVFDIMKGIGILLVLIGHLPGLLPGLKTFIYSFHMPLFFLLAGYFSKDLGDGEVLKQIGKDAKRLLLPFVFTQLLLLVWTAVQWLFKHNSDMFVRALLSMLWGG